ncbi:MAG TPA: outer membrane beta-barrel protein [Saprospiraceae bacterium]|nr:outer membrane beta-barrel protein [Saprospiraceae bacterium]
MWQIPVENEISYINKAGNLAQLKTNNSIQLIDLLNGRTKTRIDLGDLKIWPSTDGKFLLSGGIDSVVSLLRPDGTLIDTLHLPAPIEQVSASRFFPFLIVTLQSGDVFILEDPSTNPHTNPLKQTAEKNILQTSIQPLPPRRNIRPSRKNTREISFDNRLRDKRYGLSCENISAQLCTKTGCSPVTHYRSFGLSYKKYYERFWALQLELYLLNRGAKGFKKNQIDQYEYKLRYLNFNCLGEIGTNANRKLRLYLVLGPYYAFPLNAQYDVTRQSGAVEHYDFTSRHDFGAVGGLGLDLDLRKVFFFAEYRVRDSFRPLVNEPPTPGATLSKGKLSSVGFTVGLGIGL